MKKNNISECKSANANNNNYNNINNDINDNRLVSKYIHDIRNSRTFSIDDLRHINNLSHEDRMKILLSYNEMMVYYVSLLNDA
jgi:hypothetical protein